MALISDFGARQWLPHRAVRRIGPALTARMPKGLYARSIMIVVLPIVILQDQSLRTVQDAVRAALNRRAMLFAVQPFAGCLDTDESDLAGGRRVVTAHEFVVQTLQQLGHRHLL